MHVYMFGVLPVYRWSFHFPITYTIA